MSHGCNYGDLGGGDDAGEAFIVERCEILSGAAAPRNDDDVHIALLVEVANSRCNVMRGCVSLHLRGINQNIHGMVAALENVEDVAQRSRLSRRYNADAGRKRWNLFLALGCEESFGFELGFELLECQLERSRSFGLEIFGGNLQFAAILVDGDASAGDYLQAVGGAETQQPGRRTEHHYTNLGVP